MASQFCSNVNNIAVSQAQYLLYKSCSIPYGTECTVQLQISVVKHFRDFREFDDHYENFCHEIFLMAA